MDDVEDDIAALTLRVTAIETAIAGLPAALLELADLRADLTALQTAVTALGTSLAGDIADLQA
jgi:hypothetical protein